jgi:putative transposase
MEKQSFDFEAFKKQAATRIKNGETLLGKEGVLTPLLKEFLEGALEGELEAHIEENEEANRKNGKGKKKVKTPVGAVDIATPRDRNGTFEPEIVAKRSKTLGWILTVRSSPCMPGEPVTVISGIISRRCMIWMFRRPP